MAKNTRCLTPPERVFTYISEYFVTPVKSIALFTMSVSSFVLRRENPRCGNLPCSTSTFTGIAGITWRICGRNAISFARSFELIFERSVPSSTIEPSVKSAVLLRLDISVVFPQPLGPMIVVIRPDGTSSEMFFNIVSL